MDSRQLKAFVAVFEERNITQAAQRLFITQPTLSVTIRQLEDMLGAPLFVRQPRGVAVTEEARLFYPQARKLLDQMESVSSLFRERRSCEPMLLGVDGDIAPSRLSRILRLARQRIPGLLLSAEPGCVGDARVAPEDLRCEDDLFLPLWEERFVLAVPAQSPLAGLAEVDLAALGQEDWITCPGHESHQRLLAMHGENSRGVMLAAKAGSLALAARMVEAGWGVALLPATLLEELGGVCGVPAAGPQLTRRIGLCYAAQALDKPVVARLHALLADEALSGALSSANLDDSVPRSKA
ncbi:LysR family transcriptional regulator [uncultured Aquitalea sp.]|uniref:LysR family transcriptional regulator n=1 Tax=uncultured Aquitalea sp. TaxID=540272 RepID=UPI0025F9B690|nr:LysR family transcriptional regulator [uncultured Aquitalea sp.]